MGMGSRALCLHLTKHCAGVVEESSVILSWAGVFDFMFEQEEAPIVNRTVLSTTFEYYFASSNRICVM